MLRIMPGFLLAQALAKTGIDLTGSVVLYDSLRLSFDKRWGI